MLLGGPYTSIDLNDDTNLYENIKDNLKKGFILTATCSNDKALQGKFESIGLLPQYSYTLVATREIEYTGRNEQLIVLRNPWGWFGNEWKGKWSKSWYGWTKELKALLKEEIESEGIFLMEFYDFLDFFAFLHINKVHDDYHYTSDTFRHKLGAYSIRKIVIDRPVSHCYFGLHQYDKRYFRNRLESEKYNYAFGRIIIGRKIDYNTIEKELEIGGNFTQKINNGYIKKMSCGFEYEYIDGTSGRMRNLFLETNLETGEYYIIVMMDWDINILDVTLSCYSEESVEFKRVDFLKNYYVLDEIMGGYAFENIFPLETNNNNVSYKNYKFFAKKEALIIEGFENVGEKEINIVKGFNELHPIFRIAHLYKHNYGNKMNGSNGVSKNESEDICYLNVLPEKPSFICFRFTNMDKYNIIGLDKNLLRYYFKKILNLKIFRNYGFS